MGRSDENNPGVIGPVRSQGGVSMGGAKMVSDLGNHRRALASINPNLVGAPVYPTMNKRGLAEKHPLCDKIPPIPVHRPVTRKFAAQLAHKEHEPCAKVLPSEVARKTAPFTTNPSEYQDCTIIDVDEYESESDPVPMYVKHTEAMLDEIDQMEEVEMEDAAVDPDMDIDSCDADNPLAVVDYIDDIYAHYWNTESSSFVSPTYMSFQSDINEKMRGILIDWLIEVHYKFELMDETLFLTVNLIDRFLAMQTMDRKKLQLVGVTAMLLACKYEEVSVPVVDDLILISDKAYTRKEVLAMEKLMVNTLQFNMSVPTPYVFMRRLLKAAQSDKKHELLSFFIIELCLVEYEMLKFPPSLLAAAAIFTAQCTIDKFKHWSKTCTWHSRYSEDQLMECSKLMVAFHQKASTGRLTAVHKKYSTFKFGYAAKAEAACFLLQTNF